MRSLGLRPRVDPPGPEPTAPRPINAPSLPEKCRQTNRRRECSHNCSDPFRRGYRVLTPHRPSTPPCNGNRPHGVRRRAECQRRQQRLAETGVPMRGADPASSASARITTPRVTTVSPTQPSCPVGRPVRPGKRDSCRILSALQGISSRRRPSRRTRDRIAPPRKRIIHDDRFARAIEVTRTVSSVWPRRLGDVGDCLGLREIHGRSQDRRRPPTLVPRQKPGRH